LVYKGLATPPGTLHEKWPAWFSKVSENLVDIRSLLKSGFTLHNDSWKDDFATGFNGYSIIQARHTNVVKSLVKGPPFLFSENVEDSRQIFELTG